MTLLGSMLLTNLMGDSEYGVYTLVMTWILVLANFSNLGIDSLSVREAASLKAKAQFKSINGLKQFSNVTVFATSLIVTVLTISVVYFLAPFEDQRINQAFILAALFIPVYALIMLRSSILRGLQHIISSEVPLKIIKPFVLISIAFFMMMTSMRLTAYQAILINFPAFILAFVIVRQSLISKTNSFRSFKAFFKRDVWMRVGLSFFLLDNFHLLNAKVDTLMLGGMLSTADIGIYGIAIKISDLVNVLFAVGITVLGPLVSKLYTENKPKLLEKTLKSVGRVVFSLSVIAFLFLLFFGKWLLGLFGEGFPLGYTSLIILSLAHLINIALGPVGLVAVMTKYEKNALKATVIRFLVNVIFVATLVPIYGINGAAIAIAVSMLLWNLYLWNFCKRKIGIDPSIF